MAYTNEQIGNRVGLAYNEGQLGRVGSSLPQPPSEPTMLNRAEELLKHLSELDREQSRLRSNLLGVQVEAASNGIEANPTTVEGMLRLACQRVACLVGDMATINGRIG